MDILGSALDGLVLLLEPENLLLLLIGVAVGIVFGLLPGLGGPVTVALLLPFIFGMTPAAAFALLLGMLAAQGTAGDVTSVLYGVPGDVASATTVLDGHAMARHGEGGRALGIVLASSVFGGLFGALVLAASIPIVRPLVLALGPPEYFVLAFVALIFISAMSPGRLLQGYLMASVGFLAAFVGLDPQAGVPRYTFDQLYLWGGVPIAPLVMGLFAIPEIMMMMLVRPFTSDLDAEARRRSTDSIVAGAREAARHWRLALRAGGTGAAIGIIPGIGGSVSQWIAYADAKSRSKAPHAFGQGAPDGLVASGAVNNGRDGGQLVPTLAFGVPGSGIMAVFLGAFLIVGLVPGPSMLSENLDITFLAVWAIVICNLVAIVMLAPFLRPLTRLASIRESLLVPGILAVVVTGTYTNARTWNDIFVLAVAGAIGIIGLRFGWPVIPFLLAFVLGEIVERNMLISIATHGSTGWIARPGVAVLLAIGALVLLRAFVRGRRMKKGNYSPMTMGTPSRLSVKADLVITFVLLLMFLTAAATATSWPEAARMSPLVVCVIGIAIATFLLGRNLTVLVRSGSRTRVTEPALTAGTPAVLGIGGAAEIAESAEHAELFVENPVIEGPARRVFVATGWMLGLLGAIALIGMGAGILAFTFFYLRVVAKVRVISAGLYALALAVAIESFFIYFLHFRPPAALVDLYVLAFGA